MRLDEAINRIVEDLSSEPVLLEVCLAVVRSVASRDADQFRRVTPRMVSKMANASEPSATMSALAYLCGERVPVFIPRYSFIDDDHDEMIDDEVMRLLMNGEPYHDAHGDVFESPLDRVFTHFELSPQARDMANSAEYR